MNWEAIGAMGEVGGAIAVVATLGYLAVQIRQNTKATRSSASQAVTSTVATNLITAASSDTLTEVMSKVMMGAPTKELKPVERARIGLFFRGQFRTFENQYYQSRQGLLDDIWPGHRFAMVQRTELPFLREWWPDNREAFGPHFREFIDEAMARSPVGRNVFQLADRRES